MPKSNRPLASKVLRYNLLILVGLPSLNLPVLCFPLYEVLGSPKKGWRFCGVCISLCMHLCMCGVCVCVWYVLCVGGECMCLCVCISLCVGWVWC